MDKKQTKNKQEKTQKQTNQHKIRNKTTLKFLLDEINKQKVNTKHTQKQTKEKPDFFGIDAERKSKQKKRREIEIVSVFSDSISFFPSSFELQ